MKKSQFTKNNMIDVELSESAWTELAVGIPMEMRFIHYARGTTGLMLRSRDGRKMIRIVLNKEKRAMDQEQRTSINPIDEFLRPSPLMDLMKRNGVSMTNQDFEDQKLATVSAGFDSVEDEQSWLQYLDQLAATQDAEELERFAAESAYEEKKLGKMMKGNF